MTSTQNKLKNSSIVKVKVVLNEDETKPGVVLNT